MRRADFAWDSADFQADDQISKHTKYGLTIFAAPYHLVSALFADSRHEASVLNALHVVLPFLHLTSGAGYPA
jgi:hypothetical protein